MLIRLKNFRSGMVRDNFKDEEGNFILFVEVLYINTFQNKSFARLRKNCAFT